MDSLNFSPACERNKQAILEVLQRTLPASGMVLEIGSGTGQHVVHFSAELTKLVWQPSEQMENLAGLKQRLDLQAGSNVLSPIVLDVAADWPDITCEAAISANTAHIMSWQEVTCMFQGVSAVLVDDGVFCLYGPFNEDGKFTALSNQQFDESLRARNPLMGIRDVEALEELAKSLQMKLEQKIQMPANNRILVFRKVS